MKITNRHGLPEAVYQAIANKSYSKGDSTFSVTELLTPARQNALKGKYDSILEEDASDRLFALFGELVHSLLERASDGIQNHLPEKRLVLSIAGVTVSGAMDSVTLDEQDDCWTLRDFKFTSTYKAQLFKKEMETLPNSEWFWQQQYYKLILGYHGYEVNRIQIVTLLRDWQASKARFDKNYPEVQVMAIDVPVYDDTVIEEHMHERIYQHLVAQQTLDQYKEDFDNIKCSDEERWLRPTVYAVMKGGNKRAIKLCNTQEEADRMVDQLGGEHFVQVRKGEAIRCETYCPVSQYCNQYLEED